MSYQNFVPTVWAAQLERERERAVVAAKLCYREWEGQLADAGDTVKITGVGRPTIGTYVKNSTVITPENLQAWSVPLQVNQSKYFAFEVDDIDKRQAAGKIMGAQMAEAAAALAEDEDSYIYTKYADAGHTVDLSGVTTATLFSKIMAGIQYLWTQKVPKNETLHLEASPGLLAKMVLAKIVHASTNDKTVDNGYVDQFLNCKTYLANGVYNDGTYDYCFLRTKKAIGLVDQMSKTEAYRPESAFSDAVKGLHLYDAKVIRPKELVVLKFSAGAETAI